MRRAVPRLGGPDGRWSPKIILLWMASLPPLSKTALPDFEAEGDGVDGHVGSTLVDEANDADGHLNFSKMMPFSKVRPSRTPRGSGKASISLTA